MKKTLLSFLLLSSAAVASAQLQLGTAEYKGYSKYIQAVDEYVPAPGQFVNTLPTYAEGDDAATVDEAVAEANRLGIHGKETTPFLLAKIKDITGGDSLASNIQLVYNNARLAAKTACELVALAKN